MTGTHIHNQLNRWEGIVTELGSVLDQREWIKERSGSGVDVVYLCSMKSGLV